MGNILECVNRFKKPRASNIKKKKLLMHQEFATTPVNANNSNMLVLNPSVNTNVLSEFNWSRIQSIYLGFNGSLDSDLKLSLPMVKSVEKLFDILEENLICNSKRIYHSVVFLGKIYTQKFEECTKITTNDFCITSPTDRMIAHIISIIKMHRLILTALKHDFSEAQEILDLVALSHLTMNVTPSDFKLLDIALEKFLLQHKLIDCDMLKIVVAYFSLITNYICEHIDKKKNHSLVNEILSIESEDINKPRDNSHQLRKWRRLVEKLRYETSTYIEELLVDDLVSEQHTKSYKFKRECPLGHVRDIHTK